MNKFHYNPSKPKTVVFADAAIAREGASELNMFDPSNPDIGLFDIIDGELIALAGSEMLIFKYSSDTNFDDLYDEHRGKVMYL